MHRAFLLYMGVFVLLAGLLADRGVVNLQAQDTVVASRLEFVHRRYTFNKKKNVS